MIKLYFDSLGSSIVLILDCHRRLHSSVAIRACERSGKRSGAGRKSGEAEREAGLAENDGAGAERGAGGRGAETERGAG